MRNRFRAGKHTLFLCAIISICLISCATNPVTGKREFMLMTESQEIAMGQEYDPQITASYGAYEDAALSQYVNELGQKLARTSHRPNLAWNFRVLDTPVVNAFAVPGGYVYVTRGIMAYLDNEAELAAVLGHEIGHVAARHTAQQYSKSQLASLGLGVGQILSEDFRKYAGYAELGVSLLFLRFSRDNERQADDLGVEYSSKVGYDATRMSDFFTTLERLSGAAERGGLPGWFSTHPSPVDRIAACRKKAQEWQQKLGPQIWAVNRDPYLSSIDGLVFGDDPRQGFVQNNTFYHPSLRFQYPVPNGWQVQNLPTQVQIVSPDTAAAILMNIGQGTDPQAVAQAFVESSGGQVQSSGKTTVNGLSAYRLISDVPASEETSYRVQSYFIAWEGHVYVLHGLTSLSRFNAYSNAFITTMNGFAPLRDQNILNVQPDRIDVQSAGQTAPLRTLLAGHVTSELGENDLAIMNGLNATDVVKAGALFKFVVPGR